MSNDALLLTLGHNSSAILVINGEIVCGYENERITHKKSDSSFPLEAILEIKKHHYVAKDIDVFISHWFTDLSKPLHKQGKWYSEPIMDALFPDSKIYTLNNNFTHHDAHAWSADCFCGEGMPVDTYTIVADGFGSYGETMSIYGPGMKLLHRAFGFKTSLGLMYQYATSYLGMKENQDEYKLLGYEAHIQEIGLSHDHWDTLTEMIEAEIQRMLATILVPNFDTEFDPVVSISALPATKEFWRERLDIVLEALGLENGTAYKQKVVVSFYIQSVIEQVLVRIVNKFRINNLILVGGIFLNVKLNNEISHHLDGILSIMPLSGDQGAAIGVYHNDHKLKWPDHLYWGKRNLHHVVEVAGVFTSNDPQEVIRALATDKIVNIVRGDMEYGARALCHTTTLALPTPDNVKYINSLNGRSTIMPMAPVVKESDADGLFMDRNKIYKSLEYMVCARDCQQGVDPDNYGVTHTSPLSGIRTCRPQTVYNDPYMTPILDVYGYLINTSFNEHGMPIVFDINDVYRCHEYQKGHDKDDRVVTFISED